MHSPRDLILEGPLPRMSVGAPAHVITMAVTLWSLHEVLASSLNSGPKIPPCETALEGQVIQTLMWQPTFTSVEKQSCLLA